MSNSAAINGKLSVLSARSGFHLVSSQTNLFLLGEINKPAESKAWKVKLQHSNLQKMYIVCVLCHTRNMRPDPEFPHFRWLLGDFPQADSAVIPGLCSFLAGAKEEGEFERLNSAQVQKLHLPGGPKTPSMIREWFGETTPPLQALLGQGPQHPWLEFHTGDRVQ